MVYQFKNKKTGKIVDIVMSMKDYKPYRGKSDNEDHWERVYDVPQVNIGNATVVDPSIPNVPLIFVPYVALPIFIVFTSGNTRSVPVPIFIPPVAVESEQIIIGPVVC